MLEQGHNITNAIKPPLEVLVFANCDKRSLSELVACFGISIELLQKHEPIPGSFWGDEEAGLISNRLLLRPDTPVHSILHEACHYICMDKDRRNGLHTNAGGDYDEENAVCYLQIVLAGHLPGMGVDRMLDDMDLWGYTFRLGSARAWFERDATDARDWLLRDGLVDEQGRINKILRK